ncbi:FAD-binding monooxygenase [Hoeflea ulvae]|uniref:FAD-binding monooxygenase n=1 Tax=Hoeflea ulvae TaxID=2983764 RepID=A0ABT3YLV7_9HYPH|nr:FAD-binding monooxygenase [Hoeflea ulvae]MCY0096911.1 FAD-binding monooxygenase [Hoeflea ulvae]
MQYHLDGFRPGDPEVFDAAVDRPLQDPDFCDSVDVLIVGSGPAGLTLAAQLAAFPEIRTRIVERRPSALEKGQADGISCRSMEMFNAFGFAEKVLKQGYWVNETTFWKPDPETPEHIARNGRVQDVEDGLSEMPHMILNQARVHDMYLELMRNSPSRLEPDYALELAQLSVDPAGGAYPVTATLARLDPGREGETVTLKARYVVGCDGARSAVRKAIGRELSGDSANQAWGVMDVLASTDFPDIRCKTLIQSASQGNIIIIPREGGYLTRLYIELDKLDSGERVATRNLTIDHLVAAAQRIFRPFSLDVREVAWWSVYEIGQRLTDKFDDVPAGDIESRLPRVFICGDACHTHSPKAGQGMNVSMGDAFNLGWKLVSVLKGQCRPAVLHSYSAERQAVARDLIAFDREWSRIMSAPPEAIEGGEDGEIPVFQRYFIQHGRYTAGMSVKYQSSELTGTQQWPALAPGFEIGTRFHSAPVVRLADAKPLHLGHVVQADTRWRLFAFCPDQDPSSKDSAIARLCRFLAEDPASPVRRFTAPGQDIDAVFDVRAIFQQGTRELALETLPGLLKPQKGRLGLVDYEKMFCPDPKHAPDIFDARGIDRTRGCLVIVRPDQYIGHVLPLDAHEELAAFFGAIMLEPAPPS